MDTDVDQFLRDKETDLLAQMARLAAPAQDQGSISFGKRVGDGTAMAVDRLNMVQAHEQLGGLLEEVRRARTRLAEGTYGTCEVCGETITPARLEARPWATRCLRHAAALA